MPKSKSGMGEYLVPLGFDINTDGIKGFFSMVDEGRKKISEFSFISNNKILQTVNTYVGLAAKAAEATLDFTQSVASFDKNMELEARKMWMTKDAYMAVNQAVTQLGYSMDDIGTIALDPELSSQFRQLYSMTQDFQGDYNKFSESLRTMREFEFKFKQFSLLGNYFLKILGGSLVKYFEGPLGEANSSLSDIIVKLQKDMPKYVDIATRKIGPFISSMIRKGKGLLDVTKSVYTYFSKNPEALSRTLKALSVIYTLLNPVKGLALFIFSKISEYVGDINDGTVDMEKKWGGVKRFVESVADLLGTIYDFVKKIITKLDEWGVLDWFASVFDWFADLLGGRFGKITSEKSPEEMTFGDKAGKFINDAAVKASSKIDDFVLLNSVEDIRDKVFTDKFIKTLRSMNYDPVEFYKSDYYGQIQRQYYENKTNNTNNAITITNNYNNVSASDARRLSEAEAEQLNAVLSNMSY